MPEIYILKRLLIYRNEIKKANDEIPLVLEFFGPIAFIEKLFDFSFILDVLPLLRPGGHTR